MYVKFSFYLAVLLVASTSPPSDGSKSHGDGCAEDSKEADEMHACSAGISRSSSLLQTAATAMSCQEWRGGILTTSMLENWTMTGIASDWTRRILPRPAKTARNIEAFVSAPAPTTRAQNAKLALLFFVKDSLGYLWEQWAREAADSGQQFKILIHAYGIDHPDNFTSEFFKPFLVQEKAATSWCNLWPAEMLLLREALKDPDVSHLATMSADSIPFKPLSFVHRELERDPASRFCGARNGRAETWWLLDRGHAELFRDHEDLLKDALVRKSSCSEEAAWFFPMLLRKTRLKSAMPLLVECVMFTDWTCAGRELERPLDVSLLMLLQKEPRTLASFGHPMTYHHLRSATWEALNASDYWWGRKFLRNSSVYQEHFDISQSRHFL